MAVLLHGTISNMLVRPGTSQLNVHGGCFACEHHVGLEEGWKGSPDLGVSDLGVCGVHFQCCFRVVWVLLHCFSFSGKVDESICRVRGLPFVFLHALLIPSVL